MIEVKTEIVIGYHTILDFSSVGRRLMNRYSEFVNQRKIENTGAPGERVILVSTGENYFFDCTWERIAFVAQGSRSTFRKKDGKTRFFFDLLEQIAKLDQFIGFTGLKLNTSDIAESDEGAIHDVNAFKDEYLGKGVPTPAGRFDDVNVVVESKTDDFEIHHSFGPYRPESDISKHDLLVFRGPKIDLWADLQSASGLLSHARIEYKGREVSREKFIEADNYRYDMTKSLEN